MSEDLRLQVAPTRELGWRELASIRALMEDAFDDFTDHDWDHLVGGVHALAYLSDELVAHASVIRRTVKAGQRPYETGYVEGVATSSAHRRKGFGSAVLNEIGSIIVDRYELGALGTGEHEFYESLGWQRWPGPTGVETPNGRLATPEDDGAVMFLLTPRSGEVDTSTELVCDWRDGDVW